MKHKFTIIILFATCFNCFSNSIKAQNFDIDLLKKINVTESKFLRSYSTAVSKSTEITAVSVPVILGTIALVQKNDDLLKDAVYIVGSMGVNTLITYGLKYSFNRQRPYDKYSFLDVPYPESSPSFPSGHTSIAFTTATALTLKYPKWYVALPSYFWACSVAYSRMNLGVHYPSDVLAGAFLGTGSAYLTQILNDWFWKKQNNKKILSELSYWY